MDSVPISGVYKKENLDLKELLVKFIEFCSEGSSGSALFFLGIARKKGKGNKEVAFVEMESYEEHANKAIRRICEEVKSKYSVSNVFIWHLIGKFKVGEPIVLVAISSEHRDKGFQALIEAVERYKKEPALFKKEVYLDNTSLWIEGA
jgi:Molybdopterin converting factor, large subunit